MKKMDLFKDDEIKGIVVEVIDKFTIKGYSFTKYLCYTKDHRLIILVEEDVEFVKVVHKIDDTLAFNAILPAYDLILGNSFESSYHYIYIEQ